MNAIIDVFLVWWLYSGRYTWSKVRRRLFESRYRKVALPAASSVNEIQSCLKQVTWTMDGGLHFFDSISYPQTTWARKKDDCDGFATLAAELLEQMDAALEPVLVTVMLRPVRASHTVCVFSRPDGRLSFFDNDTLRDDFITYGDVIKRISRGARKVVCWDVRKHDSFERLEFHRQPPAEE